MNDDQLCFLSISEGRRISTCAIALLVVASGVSGRGAAPAEQMVQIKSSPAAVLPVDVEEALSAARNYQPESGVWGVLDSVYLTLEPPDRLVDELIEQFPWRDGPVWQFQGALADVREKLSDFGLTASPDEADTRFEERDGFVHFRPPAEFIERLSSSQRAYLYRYIAPFEDTNTYHVPMGLHPGGFRFMTGMAPSGLSSSMIDRVDRLSFRRSGRLPIFADLSYCMQLAETDQQRSRLLKTLGRQFSLRLRLKISRGQDLSPLIEYWGGRGRNKEVLPMLASVAETSGVEMLDIVHLLPPTPRKLLHTYPMAEMTLGEESPDCFSTSVSFFSDEPPTRYLDSIHHVVEERYERATKPWQFGDLLLMRNPDSGEMLHACNYLAADIVFTKNGSDRFRPWILSRIEEVMNTYLEGERLSASFYRLKPDYQR